ncbi:MAG: 4Fe-4S dicluster domain-containing protein [Anaerolineales bacterium]|nr:4Fe-4S dicluster domain-containing protein [Anaerolineales bacterium]
MKALTRQQIAAWLDELAQQQQLIAPVQVAGLALYRQQADSRQIDWDYGRPEMSAKEFFFPPTERLMTITRHADQVEITETLPHTPQVLFGLRPCDARGLLALDAMFIDTEPVDPYYAGRREQTTLIGLACREMGETCFCTTTGGAPDDPTGMDVMLFEEEGGYRVEVYTEKGFQIVQGLGVWEAAQPGSLNESPTPLTPIPLPPKEAWPAQFASPFWAEFSERCLSCRACAYVCPTCRCFDLRDEALPAENGQQVYERVRCWDSCAGTVYRRIAGGHNPRAAKGERMRNRFMCKFYYYPEQYGAEKVGPAACTGCGRCIDACPVNIDITEVLAHLVEVSV